MKRVEISKQRLAEKITEGQEIFDERNLRQQRTCKIKEQY